MKIVKKKTRKINSVGDYEMWFRVWQFLQDRSPETFTIKQIGHELDINITQVRKILDSLSNKTIPVYEELVDGDLVFGAAWYMSKEHMCYVLGMTRDRYEEQIRARRHYYSEVMRLGRNPNYSTMWEETDRDKTLGRVYGRRVAQ